MVKNLNIESNTALLESQKWWHGKTIKFKQLNLTTPALNGCRTLTSHSLISNDNKNCGCSKINSLLNSSDSLLVHSQSPSWVCDWKHDCLVGVLLLFLLFLLPKIYPKFLSWPLAIFTNSLWIFRFFPLVEFTHWVSIKMVLTTYHDWAFCTFSEFNWGK